MLQAGNEEAAKMLGDMMVFAAQVGAIDALIKQLAFLGRYGQHSEKETRCLLFPDFAPHSLRFVMEARQAGEDKFRRWFVGGLIYSGPGVPADGSFPSCTVSLDPDAMSGRVHTWSVHT